MPNCSVFCCKKRSGTSNLQKDGVSFHMFAKDPSLRNTWKKFCNNRTWWTPTRNSFICSDHFKASDFQVLANNRRRLVEGTIPTLAPHCTCSNHQLSFTLPGDRRCDAISATLTVPDSLTSSCTPQQKEDLDPDSNIRKIHYTTKTRNPQLFTRLFCKHCSAELQHTIVEDQTKVLIARVYHYFECEYEELKKLNGDRDLTPLSNFRQRTALATGVSETTVLQILKEEEKRNAEKREELKRTRALKRSIQTKSPSLEDSSDDSISDVGQPSNVQEAQNEPEVETLVVKLEPECDKEQVQINTDPLQVKAEPLDEDVNVEQVQINTDPLQVKAEPLDEDVNVEQVQINTDPVQVKAEPPDEDVKDTNETLALPEPAVAKRRRRKSSRKSDVTSARQQTQGESSTAAAWSSVRLTEELDESGLSEEIEVKVEKIEIGEEGFS